ncbi:2-dehydro-3-deoxygalactonokinase [Mucilaginibacter sabulilitoris]|uniref:2-dehydro-3-deoxygalactonokinase n=1 Tax=Mucilaginibacter sabulilitoris TaxID=1173583 RepID=A0ABZ0TNC7_9SPHI|nr:2-dehydro-3-deoxygalactonokinase [Mucilaginibacter sabulilitoris]WPU94374.1 2-dehydro-3-deoxygalactonokinase [Mucilaginibacter sabulilitoris]
MNMLLSCDWGTSALRLNLIDAKSGQIMTGERSDSGIAKTFELWKATNITDENSRIAFYLDVLQQLISNIETRLSVSLNGVKLFISGMASSSIGFIELPYSQLPFALSGPGLQVKHLPAPEGFNHAISMISGVRSADDVMRGEETQLIGCVEAIESTAVNQVFILPGTHSKHIYVHQNNITGFKTYMTGDLFELLSQKSILHNSVEKENDIEAAEHALSFKQGVTDAAGGNLLHAIFKVRTNNLFNVYTKKQNFFYLSGLLIGTELKDLAVNSKDQFHLLCGAGLEKCYRMAFEQLNMAKQLKTYPPQWVDEAVVRAHHKIYNQIGN